MKVVRCTNESAKKTLRFSSLIRSNLMVIHAKERLMPLRKARELRLPTQRKCHTPRKRKSNFQLYHLSRARKKVAVLLEQRAKDQIIRL